jgi:hypothetical protein
MNEIWVRSTGAMKMTRKLKYLLCRKTSNKIQLDKPEIKTGTSCT